MVGIRWRTIIGDVRILTNPQVGAPVIRSARPIEAQPVPVEPCCG
jgi:hypothetical protein